MNLKANICKLDKKNNRYFKSIFIIALPIIIQGLVVQLQTLINRMFLGNSKAEYLTVVGNSIFPYATTVAVVISVSTGLTILIAQNMGAKKVKEAKMYALSSIFFSSVISILLFTFWFFFCQNIFKIMGVDKELIKYCVGYVKIISISLFLLGIDSSIQAMLQGVGLTKPIMYSGILKIFLNIILDWILIFGKLGFPSMGLYGAALATCISNVFAGLLLVVYIMFSRKLPFKIKFYEVLQKKSFLVYKIVLRVGLPTGFESFVWYMGSLVFIKILNQLDITAVGIYTLIFGIDIAVFGIYNGIAKASLVLVGNKIGESNEQEARKILTSVIKYNIFIVSIVFLIFLIYSKYILGLFSSDKELMEKSTLYFTIMAFTLYPKSLNVVVGSGIRGFGNTRWMLQTQIIGTLFVIFSSCIMVFIFKLGIASIYITIFIDELMRTILNTYHFYWGNIQKNQERLSLSRQKL